MSLPTDARVVAAELFFLPVHTRVPLKFGTETATFVTCARAKLTVRGRDGREATGWGETPLSVTWVWPSKLSYEERHEALKNFCLKLANDGLLGASIGLLINQPVEGSLAAHYPARQLVRQAAIIGRQG